jgi:hypothetical protein
MTIVMHDLAGADPALRFSPYCWRARMALAHKGLAVETIPWRFTEKAALAFSGQGRVPVIRDGDRVVSDSWAIAEYLEDTYPDRPSLFGGAAGRAHARFINAWADAMMMGGIARLIIRDLLDVVAPQDEVYFRESREARFGMTLEAVQAGGKRAWRSSARRCCRCGRCWESSRGWAVRPRVTRITSCSALCSGRAARAGSNCWRAMIRSPHGASGCWICSTDWDARRRRPEISIPR